MKKTFLSLSVAILCALPSCQKQEIQPETASRTVAVQFTTEPLETRTAFSEPVGGSYATLWNQGDEVTLNLLSLNEDAEAKTVTPTISADGKTASFSIEVPEGTTSDVFYAMCPAASNLARDNQYKTWVLQVPTNQTPGVNSPDPASQLIWARSEFSSLPDKVSLQFRHITAYGRLNLNNLAIGDATLQAVTLGINAKLFGRYFFFIDEVNKGGVDYMMGDLQDNRASGDLTINTASATNIWFSCFPLSVSGTTLTVTAVTDKGTVTKKVTIPEGQSFQAGKVTTINVDMSGIPLLNPVTYQRVNAMSEITPEDDVIIAALNGQKNYAINNTQAKNARSSSEVSVENDKILDPGADVAIFKVEAGSSAGTWRFRATNGTKGYLYAGSPTTSSSNTLKTSADGSGVDNFEARSSWSVSLTDGTAHVQSLLVTIAPSVATVMQLNTGNNNFSCYIPDAFPNFAPVSFYKKVSK